MTAEASVVPSNAELKESVAGKIKARRASLTDVEQAFLHALLVDDPAKPADEAEEKERLKKASRRLDDDMLFSAPVGLKDEYEKNSSKREVRRSSVKKDPNLYRFLVGLWQAHEDGVDTKRLGAMETSLKLSSSSASKRQSSSKKKQPSGEEKAKEGVDEDSDDDDGDSESAHSDQEVRTSDDVSDCSWDEEAGGFDHFDAWQVLKDEYAKESGFDYAPDGAEPCMDDSCEHHTFKILGTGADDTNAHPHVISPPLIDSLMNFIPDHLEGQNMWMKYSLVRDGANLDTFKQYVRASKDSILAIETTQGDVFGCYTSSPWRTTFSFFGGAPSFVWRMRHSRNTPCHSLIEQAQLESEVDIFFLLDNNSGAQCLRSDMLAVGEGDVELFCLDEEETESDSDSGNAKEKVESGFAFALRDDLLSGTTTRCSSYKSPCLVDTSSKSKSFEILNLELWTFTPCFSLDSAEKLEMTQFFVSETIRSASLNSGRNHSASSDTSQFSSTDFSPEKFYRRVGQGDEHEELRERWQYRNMMDGTDNNNPGLGGSPRFGYS